MVKVRTSTSLRHSDFVTAGILIAHKLKMRNVYFYLLHQKRGEGYVTSSRIKCITGKGVTQYHTTPTLSDHERTCLLNHFGTTTRGIAIGMSEDIALKLVNGENIILDAAITLVTPEVFKCVLCGRKTETLICKNHRKSEWDMREYSTPNNYIEVHKPINPKIDTKYSFGIEFEVTSINESLYNEIQTVLDHFNYLNSEDGTVYAEFKSPIQKGFVNVKALKAFEVMRKRGIIGVGSEAGTHLHLSTSDNTNPFSDGFKLYEEAEKKVEMLKYIKSLESIFEIAGTNEMKKIFGRAFTGYAQKLQIYGEGIDNVIRGMGVRKNWINLSGEHNNRTMEIRLFKFRNAEQYIKCVYVAIRIFKDLKAIVYDKKNPFTLAKRFESYFNNIKLNIAE